jgi:hypothetical protein
MYDIDNLEKHLVAHLSPQYVKSAPVNNNTIPNRPVMNDESAKTDRSDIWVTSFLANELPQT